MDDKKNKVTKNVFKILGTVKNKKINSWLFAIFLLGSNNRGENTVKSETFMYEFFYKGWRVLLFGAFTKREKIKESWALFIYF